MVSLRVHGFHLSSSRDIDHALQQVDIFRAVGYVGISICINKNCYTASFVRKNKNLLDLCVIMERYNQKKGKIK